MGFLAEDKLADVIIPDVDVNLLKDNMLSVIREMP